RAITVLKLGETHHLAMECCGVEARVAVGGAGARGAGLDRRSARVAAAGAGKNDRDSHAQKDGCDGAGGGTHIPGSHGYMRALNLAPRSRAADRGPFLEVVIATVVPDSNAPLCLTSRGFSAHRQALGDRVESLTRCQIGRA